MCEALFNCCRCGGEVTNKDNVLALFKIADKHFTGTLFHLSCTTATELSGDICRLHNHKDIFILIVPKDFYTLKNRIDI